MMRQILLVGLGGGIGSMLRYGAALMLRSRSFPAATLLVNLTGCFIIGIVFAASLKNEAINENWKLFLATGICGGFTTFSAFSLENMQLLQSGKTGIAMLYILLSLVLGIAAAFAGYQLIIKN